MIRPVPSFKVKTKYLYSVDILLLPELTYLLCLAHPTQIKKTLPILSSQKDLAVECQPSAIGRLVAEISDLIHAQTVQQ